MSFVVVIFLCLLFFSGMVLLLGSIAQYTSYGEAKGEIIEALECNPCEDEDLLEEKNNSGESAVVVAYTVEGKMYHLATNYKKPAKMSRSKGIRVLYNPYFPGESRLKEGSPFLGSVLMLVALVGFLLLMLLG